MLRAGEWVEDDNVILLILQYLHHSTGVYTCHVLHFFLFLYCAQDLHKRDSIRKNTKFCQVDSNKPMETMDQRNATPQEVVWTEKLPYTPPRKYCCKRVTFSSPTTRTNASLCCSICCTIENFHSFPRFVNLVSRFSRNGSTPVKRRLAKLHSCRNMLTITSNTEKRRSSGNCCCVLRRRNSRRPLVRLWASRNICSVICSSAQLRKGVKLEAKSLKSPKEAGESMQCTHFDQFMRRGQVL